MEMSSGLHLVRQRFHDSAVVPWTTNLVDIHLQYWPNDNVVTDDKGAVIFNLFDMITPRDLEMKREMPYTHMYFLHRETDGVVIGISYMDPNYYEVGDYKRYPTTIAQMKLREQEVARFNDRLDDKLTNFEFRRKIYPELYLECEG